MPPTRWFGAFLPPRLRFGPALGGRDQGVRPLPPDAAVARTPRLWRVSGRSLSPAGRDSYPCRMGRWRSARGRGYVSPDPPRPGKAQGSRTITPAGDAPQDAVRRAGDGIRRPCGSWHGTHLGHPPQWLTTAARLAGDIRKTSLVAIPYASSPACRYGHPRTSAADQRPPLA